MTKRFITILGGVFLLGGILGFAVGRSNQFEGPTVSGPAQGGINAVLAFSGTLKSVSGNVITLDNGWSVATTGSTPLQYPSGAKVGLSDLKAGMNVNVTLKKAATKGQVSADAVALILVAPGGQTTTAPQPVNPAAPPPPFTPPK